MLSDYHIHSDFSGDCKVPMSEMIEKAIQLNLKRLCFTDHHDIDFPHPSINFVLDIPSYINEFHHLKDKYSNQIELLIGIELGMQPHLHNTLSTIVNNNDFDFVLASNHLAKGLDVYEKIYFENHSQYLGYLKYFEDILGNVKSYTDYDVYSHLDYVIRYGDFKNKVLAYNDFKDILDEILSTIIKNGKGIEVNTSGYNYKLDNPHPSRKILTHYKKLGGEIITLGSDAHSPHNLIEHFDLAKELLKSIGFKYHCTYVQRTPEFHKL